LRKEFSFLPEQAFNCDPLDLCLLNSWDYRRCPQHPALPQGILICCSNGGLLIVESLGFFFFEYLVEMFDSFFTSIESFLFLHVLAVYNYTLAFKITVITANLYIARSTEGKELFSPIGWN
jgi:hypothetical protein